MTADARILDSASDSTRRILSRSIHRDYVKRALGDVELFRGWPNDRIHTMLERLDSLIADFGFAALLDKAAEMLTAPEREVAFRAVAAVLLADTDRKSVV